MEGLTMLVLLSSVALLCSAAPGVGPVTCTDNDDSSVNLAVHHINEQHDHGYKFKKNQFEYIKMEEVDSGCNIELTVELLETDCHVLSPKSLEECDIRNSSDWEIKATCSVNVTVQNSDAKVTSYTCDTEKALSREEMEKICPDCPVLIALNDADGVKAVQETVKKFNQNTTNQHYFILKEVGRLTQSYIPMQGRMHFTEIALIESRCPMNSRRVPELCRSLCPDRAKHAVCSSSYSKSPGVENLKCEIYPAVNSTALSPGEQEPICLQSHRVMPAGPPGPPGTEPADGGPPSRPFPMHHACHAKADLEFHPICESH